MRWIARISSFTAALVFGAFAASFFVASQLPAFDGTAVTVELNFEISCKRGLDPRLSAGQLLGTWEGSWGYNGRDCTLEITRVEGESFFGSLNKDGAEILVRGTFDSRTRLIEFNETKVVRLGAEMSEWSLGENRGHISQDGRIMYGTGVDEWGQYAWAVSNR